MEILVMGVEALSSKALRVMDSKGFFISRDILSNGEGWDAQLPKTKYPHSCLLGCSQRLSDQILEFPLSHSTRDIIGAYAMFVRKTN